MSTGQPTIDPTDRIAVVGIGSELRGDDAVGLELARRIETRSLGSDADRLLVVEGGVAPENHTGVVRRFDPDWIVLVDAVDFGGDPGSGEWIDPDDLGGESFSSHKSTPAMLRTFLARETGADVVLFGVQPADIDRGESLSKTVEERLGGLAARLVETLRIDERNETA
ncbi:hydrogenase maturation protease [Halorhabdus amylolytica]|uniref:hydrogenase maturation protease n=1 Tax=Halorhabdus amylolytica TaxID=2559573 RepID=UPI0010AB0337|nr:hydrogenase maturation protease [Halorhabdus amylolytica]